MVAGPVIFEVAEPTEFILNVRFAAIHPSPNHAASLRSEHPASATAGVAVPTMGGNRMRACALVLQRYGHLFPWVPQLGWRWRSILI